MASRKLEQRVEALRAELGSFASFGGVAVVVGKCDLLGEGRARLLAS